MGMGDNDHPERGTHHWEDAIEQEKDGIFCGKVHTHAKRCLL